MNNDSTETLLTAQQLREAVFDAFNLTETAAHDLAGAHARRQAMDARHAVLVAIDRLVLAEAQALRLATIPPEIAEVIEQLHTQDNRITDNPLFGVQQKRQICGLDDGYEESWVWVSSDNEEITDEVEIATLNNAFNAGADTPGARRVGVAESWEFVTGSLTAAGCRAYIAANGHNLREPRIFAYGSYRNAEFIALRKWLMSLRPTIRTPA